MSEVVYVHYYKQGRRQGVWLGVAKILDAASPALKKSVGGGGGGAHDGIGFLSSSTYMTSELTSKIYRERKGKS